jgi:hypothetical protein
MSRKLICYRCFERFHPHEVKFRCENHRQVDQTGSCELENDKKIGQMAHHAFSLNDFMPVMYSFFNPPSQCKCDKCGYISKRRICPYCHHPLLFETGKIDEHIIAIIGEPGSGKSHFLTVLIERCLKGHVGADFNAFIAKADDETNRIFQKYKGPLFDDKREIPPNRPEDRADDRMLFRLNFSTKHPVTKKRVNKPITLVFYDIAGELLNTHDSITQATRYLWHSSGIIYLVNPLHLREITAKMSQEAMAPVITPDEMLSNAIEEIRKDKNISPGEEIKIPLAVCLSQSDRLRDKNDVFKFDERIFSPHRHKKELDTHDINIIDAEIQDKFVLWGGIAGNLFRIADQAFKSKAFFASSALGDSPVDGNIREINPIRLEDPFLWILSEIGIISKTKGKA